MLVVSGPYSGGDRAPWIANPLAPGTDIDATVAQSGRVDCQEQMTCRYSGPAHGDQSAGLIRQVPEACAEFLGGTQGPVGLQRIGKRPVDGAGDVTGYGIDGLGDTLKAFRRRGASTSLAPFACSDGSRAVGTTQSRRTSRAAYWLARMREISGSSGNPAPSHAFKPPSRTYAAQCPTHRSIHHKRAAIAPDMSS